MYNPTQTCDLKYFQQVSTLFTIYLCKVQIFVKLVGLTDRLMDGQTDRWMNGLTDIFRLSAWGPNFCEACWTDWRMDGWTDWYLQQKSIWGYKHKLEYFCVGYFSLTVAEWHMAFISDLHVLFPVSFLFVGCLICIMTSLKLWWLLWL